MEDVVFKVHWLAFTVHAPIDDAFILYDVLFKEKFGELEPLGHGGRGFRDIHRSLLEFKIYTTPIRDNGNYFHFEIPGAACDVIDWKYLQALGEYLEGNFDKYTFTRLDIAFDHVPFTPQQVEEAIKENELRSLAKRETLQMHISPFEKRDDGEEGTYTVEFGSRSSERMIRVYNRRGFTRLEFEVKDKRATLIAKQVFLTIDIDQWFYLLLAHLLDYIDFKTDWWEAFKDSANRAGATVSSPKEIAMSKVVHWLDKQVAPALSVAADVLPPEFMDELLKRGRRRRGAKYSLLLDKLE